MSNPFSLLVLVLASQPIASLLGASPHYTRANFNRGSLRPRYGKSLLHGGVKMSDTIAGTGTAPNWREYSGSDKYVYADGSVFPLDHVAGCDSAWSEAQYEEALQFYDKLIHCEDAYMAPKIEESLKCLAGAYRLYGTRYVVGSYNGGKDAVVILHLMRAAHAKYYHDLLEDETAEPPNNPTRRNGVHQVCQTTGSPHRNRPRVIYFESKDEFPEVVSFLRSTVDAYDLDMLAFPSSYSFKGGLNILVDEAEKSSLAFVLGTRTSDPNGHNQGMFSPSSHYMPPFMRVNPILEWTYGHVWHFLRLFQLPYCGLYDAGYTSLGSIKDTFPCPALARPQGGYWPAYMLGDWDQERAGRVVPPKTEGANSSSTNPEQTSVNASMRPSLSTLSSTGSERETALAPPQATSPAPTSSSSDNMRGNTVGLIVIGDEILKGLCTDTNTFAAATAFRSHGVLMSRVVVVPDEHDEIVDEIRRMQKEVDVIVTSGGVGPTHDDVTMRSVSTALSSPLVLHKEMADLLREKMDNTKGGGELSEAQKKMAMLPRNSKLRYFAGKDEWPTLQCRNVYILPGVPQFFEQKISSLASHLSSFFERNVHYNVVLSVEESAIVKSLNTVVKRHPHVSFGSYPFVDHPEYKTVVTIEAKEGPTHPGDTRASIRKRSGESLRRLADTKNSSSEVGSSEDEGVIISLGSLGLFTKEEMDLHVKLALADLVSELPDGSILRVNHEDDAICSQ